MPLTTGFFAKFEVIAAAVDAESYWVSAVAMVAAVVSAYLYIRVIIAMFLTEPDDDAPDVVVPATVGAVIAIAAAVTVVFGVYPGPIDDLASDALAQLALGR